MVRVDTLVGVATRDREQHIEAGPVLSSGSRRGETKPSFRSWFLNLHVPMYISTTLSQQGPRQVPLCQERPQRANKRTI